MGYFLINFGIFFTFMVLPNFFVVKKWKVKSTFIPFTWIVVKLELGIKELLKLFLSYDKLSLRVHSSLTSVPVSERFWHFLWQFRVRHKLDEFHLNPSHFPFRD